MDGTEDDGRYPPNPYGVNHHQGSGYLSGRRLPVRSSPYSQQAANEYVEDNNDDEDEEDEEQLVEEEEEEEEDDDDDVQSNSAHISQKNVVRNNDDEGDEDKDGDENDGNNDDEAGKDGDENDGNNDDDDDDNNDNDDAKLEVYSTKSEDDLKWHPKKRKLKSLISAYEFAPRVPAPSAPKPFSGGRNSLTDWTEPETVVLLDAWGDKFLQHGRKSLRSEEWQEVAEKVSQVSKIERTDAQCRNRLDTLKKKYKKETAKLAKMGGGACKWVYFHRMDKLMSSPLQQAGLSCGVDSGEYVFMNPRVYLNRASGLDEMRDSPGDSESTGEDVLDGLKPKKRRRSRDGDEASSFRLLANSIQKFSEIYEKIENNKWQQMVELEKMRMELHKDLETQKRQILERVQSEISKLHQRDDEENDDYEG